MPDHELKLSMMPSPADLVSNAILAAQLRKACERLHRWSIYLMWAIGAVGVLGPTITIHFLLDRRSTIQDPFTFCLLVASLSLMIGTPLPFVILLIKISKRLGQNSESHRQRELPTILAYLRCFFLYAQLLVLIVFLAILAWALDIFVYGGSYSSIPLNS